MDRKRIDIIAAARPNFMKVAPLWHALQTQSWCEVSLIHTGQHYDPNMSDNFFRELALPKPTYALGVGSGSHAEQTGKVMAGYEKLCQERRPDCVVVVGDVNSTLAVTIAAKKMHIPVAHLESGLRSGDRTMPEEVNRLVTDALADLLWTPSYDAVENLKREGVSSHKIVPVGNIMIDSFEMMRTEIEKCTPRNLKRSLPATYGVVTLHRPSNVDSKSILSKVASSLIDISSNLELVFPVHPRTRKKLVEYRLWERLAENRGIQLLEPLNYTEFMKLVLGSSCVISDSGGVQEETTYLGIPCVTLRENTERPTTVIHGTNILVQPQCLTFELVQNHMMSAARNPEIPMWDGNAAFRVVNSLAKYLKVGEV